jgi:hypothetical protein
MRQKCLRQRQRTKLLAFALYSPFFKQIEHISGLLHVPSLRLRELNGFIIKFAEQQATWTSGPSLPSHIPDATERHCQIMSEQYLSVKTSLNNNTRPSDLITRVQEPINVRITKPPSTVLISGIPLCFAYVAYVRTKTLAQEARKTCLFLSKSEKQVRKEIREGLPSTK